MRVFLFGLIMFASGSSLASELQLPPDKIRSGETIYVRKCGACHGRDASGASAPDVQGILVSDVIESAKGVENMPPVPLEAEEAEAIAIFLMSLAPDQAKRRMSLQ